MITDFECIWARKGIIAEEVSIGRNIPRITKSFRHIQRKSLTRNGEVYAPVNRSHIQYHDDTLHKDVSTAKGNI